jgi:hypothetical protein
MKPLSTLVVVLGAFIAGLAIAFNAPAHIDEPVRLFLGLGYAGALTIALRGPLGQALGEQLRGGPSTAQDSPLMAQLEEIATELQAMRDELAQLNDRMDFTERLLTQHQERQLGSGLGEQR